MDQNKADKISDKGRRGIKQQILNLRKKGKSYSEIQSILNCSKSTITFHAKKAGLNKSIGGKNHKRLPKEDQYKIWEYTKENGDNVAQAVRDLGFCRRTIEKYGCFTENSNK